MHILKNVIEYKTRVLVFSKNLSKTFILRRTERGIIIDEHMYTFKTSVMMVRYSLKLDILNRYLKNNQVLIFKISDHSESSYADERNDGQTTGQPNNRFRKFAKTLKVITKSNTSA